MTAEQFDVVMRHVYSEPKFVAWIEWGRDHPSIAAQMFGQDDSRPADYSMDAAGDWLRENADREVSFVLYEEPDWDWWEPRHDQPWRRQAARDRELDSLLAAA